ncbi:MAG: hypothetical protein D6769_00550 [Methanobacteriota archaeon]|nr:MAG: hypothetical protein D6769_00550 [Euryarchaeota archaeon]
MERRIICKVRNEYVEKMMLLAGISRGEEGIMFVDGSSDNNTIERDVVVLPLYDAHEFIRRRVPKYGEIDKE